MKFNIIAVSVFLQKAKITRFWPGNKQQMFNFVRPFNKFKGKNMTQRAILWFRNDLRIHDHEALTELIQKNVSVIPVYVFDERFFSGKTKNGFEKTGPFRKKFMLESVSNLRQNLRKIGADLIIRSGNTEEIIFDLAKLLKTRWVYCNRERTHEEVLIQDSLEKKLWSIGQELRYSRGKMLYYTADLPFPVTHTPDVFTAYRKEVEKIVPVRKPLPAPEKIIFEQGLLDPGELPVVPSLVDHQKQAEHTENIRFKGGETEGINQLQEYIWNRKGVETYYNTRNEMFGWEFSSKFSSWLAQGCLSPKLIFHEIQKFEAVHGENKSTYWLFFELLWRDFFRLMGKKHGHKIFLRSGIKNKKYHYDKNSDWNSWVLGNTGVPIIDACMTQLAETGFISNRGRQITASFLIHDLRADWLIGAEYFESMLIDYDPCSNYGNWNYLAGVGNDPVEIRYFNPEKQRLTYDPEGIFTNYWLGVKEKRTTCIPEFN